MHGVEIYTTRLQKLLSTLLKFWTKITLKTQKRILTQTQNVKINIKWSYIHISSSEMLKGCIRAVYLYTVYTSSAVHAV